ncbi:MAG: SusC/RagA family TonB-linked outer membrane protein [Phocaeicola vulgatus]
MKNKHAQLKLFTLFSLLLLFCTFESMAQEKLITINVKNVSLKEIFNIIENQTPYRFSYRSVVLDADRNISISAENISVTTVLNQALKDRNLEYSIVSPKTIVISDKQTGNVKSSETKKISGIIKDVNGEPIIGANVKIKGQSIGTITDIDGRFVLDASTDATLQISYIGYASLEMNTGNKKELNIVLKEDTETLEEVVVVGLSMPPILPVYQNNGDYTQIAQHYADLGLNNQLRNPVSNLLENRNDKWSIRTMSNAYFEVKPIKGLTLRTSVNFTTNAAKQDYYQSAFLLGKSYTGNKSTPDLTSIDGYRLSGFGYNAYWSTTATYDVTFNEKHHLNTMIGYDFEYNSDFEVQQDDRTDSDNPIAYNNTSITNVNGAKLWTGSSEYSNYVFDAMFARLVYDYNYKYVLSGSVRRDRSSKFGPDKRAGWFYSGSLAWNITEEDFMKDIHWLDIAKLRASYGITGNDQIGNDYAWISTISSDQNVVFGTTAIPTYYPSGYSNRQLGWEKNKQMDLGFDIGVFNALNIVVDLYKRTSDIVMPANIPNFNGIAGSVYMNAGQIENKGIEIQVSATPFKGDFSWETTLSWSKNNNKILSLANNQNQLANASAGTKWGNVMRNYVGRPMGDMYMLKVIGTFNTEKDLAQYAKNGTQDIGDLIFEDYNKDGTIDVNDYQLVGNYQPDFTFGWNNTFIYKDFDLAVTIDGQCGGNVIYAAARAFSLNRYDDNVLAESGLGRWKSSTDPGNGRSHKAGTNNLGSNIGPSTRYLYDADFLRIRNVSLGYTLPKKFCKIIGIENMRISANVQNLWTFDKYPGYSVEANYEGNSATNNGVDFGGYPISRTFTFGLNFNF